MLENQYLRYGLNALSRAHQFNYFEDGHRGAAIIAGVYFCRENPVKAGVSEKIASIIDERWASTRLCAPLPDEDPDPGLLRDVLDCTSEHLEGLREAGHNAIFPSLALKALHDVPENITGSCVSGLCRLISCFHVSDVPLAEDVQLPPLDDESTFAEFVLDEFVRCVKRFTGRGQGWSGHLLTYAQALFDLREYGSPTVARQAAGGFRIYVRRVRLGPQPSDGKYDEHSRLQHYPLDLDYWEERKGDLRLGHKLKYPYGFYGLMSKAKTAAIKRRALEMAHRIF